jgi:hypothetical protein
MKAVARIGYAVVVCLLVVMSIEVVPASAVMRSSGDFFTYSISMDLTGLNDSITMNLKGLNATGSVTYSFLGADTLSVNGQSYDVNVMTVSGSASASFSLLSISGTLGGHVYETQEGTGIVRDDAIMWLNTSIGTGSFQIVNRSETETVSTYSPPLLSGFSPSQTGPGDSWVETVDVTTQSETWINGASQGTSTPDTEQITVSYVAASGIESVSTPAGKFDTLRITATDSNGGSIVYWWSSDIGNFVKQEESGESALDVNINMILTDYNHVSSPSAILFIGIGLVVALFAVIVLVVVLLMRRRPGQPIPYQPGMPVPQPYAPPPPGPPSPGSETVLRTPQDFARRTR